MNDMKLLDTPIRQVFSDRELLNRVVSTISHERGLTYLDALERFHDAVDSATVNGSPILRTALEWAQVDPDDVEAAVTLLERRDGAVAAAFDRAAGPLLVEKTDARGLVTLDQGDAGVAPGRITGAVASRGDVPLQADIGRILTDPAEGERRLARMRAAQPSAWDGDAGRTRFKAHDRLMAESGVDAVRTAERPGELLEAQAAGNRVGAQLDQAISAAGDKRQRLRLLEAEISKLDGPAAGVREFGLTELRKQAADARREPLRMLDQLDASGEAAVTGHVPSVRLPADGHGLYELTQARMRLLDRSQDEFDATLSEVLRGDPVPVPAVREPEIPDGVHPASHALHEKVQAKLKELDRPPGAPGEYLRVLERLLYPVTVEKAEGGE
jgi:hypothetical protein